MQKISSAERNFAKLVGTARDCYLLFFVINLIDLILAALIGIQFSKVQSLLISQYVSLGFCVDLFVQAEDLHLCLPQI